MKFLLVYTVIAVLTGFIHKQVEEEGSELEGLFVMVFWPMGLPIWGLYWIYRILPGPRQNRR